MGKIARENDGAFEVHVSHSPVGFGFDDDLECSNCGCDLETPRDRSRYNYCPRCGGQINWSKEHE